MQLRKIALMLAFAGALIAADATVDKAKKQIAAKQYDEAIAGLEASYKSNPKSAEVKKTLAEAYLAKGDSMMYNESLPPRMKYPGALKAYRQVLVYDKENKKAQSGINTIEGIYKSMGRPIPQ
jgi:tetratricopeptide (TPR) repeat protein